MADFGLLLEAEKRGILPPEKQALLAEARKRGLVPGSIAEPAAETAPVERSIGEQASALVRDPLGELAAGGRQLLQHGINLQSGLVRGAGSIGATIARPFESAEANAQRRADITSGLASMGAQPNTLAFQTGKFGGEMAGTAGVGSALAVPFRAAAPVVATALESGGMASNLPWLARTGAGAVTGGLSSAAIDPTAENIGLGTVFGGAAPWVVKGIGAARDWLSPQLQARNMLLNTLGNDQATINAVVQANQAASGQRAREIAGGVSNDLNAYQTLLARAEQEAPVKTAGAARAAETAANEVTLANLAGGPTQTAAREAAQKGRTALNKATTPLREAAFADVDRAASLLQKGLQARGESAAAVQDVRKFTDMADRAMEWAKNWRSTITGAGTPAAARPPARYTYPFELAERAEGAAGAAAEESLKAGARARAAENTASFMADRGVQPLQVSTLTDAIDTQLAKPEIKANKQLVTALENLKQMGLDFAGDSGLLGPAEYYAMRKNGVNSVVQSALGANVDPSAAKRLTASVLSTIKGAVDPKMGPKFATYLNAYEEGAKELNKQKLAAEALRLYQKGDKQGFISLVEGNDPKRVQKFMGGGEYNIADAMGDDYAVLQRIANEAKLQIGIKKQASEGGSAATKAIADAAKSFRIPNMLSGKVALMNAGFAELEGKVNRKALEGVRRAAESGANMNEALLALSPSEQNAVLAMFRKYGGKAIAPTISNALAPEAQQ